MADNIYLLLYYVIGYRRKVVMGNLKIAFPEKTEEERVKIAKQFYRNFIDNFIETIKMFSMSENELMKRVTSNIEVVNALKGKVPNVAAVSGHFFNWELVNRLVSKECAFTMLGVYMPIKSKVFEKIMYDLRSEYGTILIPANKFREEFIKYAKSSYLLGLIADQNPGDPTGAYWVPFFNRLTPFVKGPERGATANNSAVVFGTFSKKKRGYYHIEFELLTTDPKSFAPGQLTKLLIEKTEEAIRKNPSLYLWSHRRWKYEYNPELHSKGLVG